MTDILMALLGFFGLLALLAHRLWREQHSQANQHLHSSRQIASIPGANSLNTRERTGVQSKGRSAASCG